MRHNIKVVVRIPDDLCGYVVATPLSEKVRKQYAKHMQQFVPDHDGAAFFQSVTELNENGILKLNPRDIQDLYAGWSKTVILPTENFGYLLGYDASLLEIK